MRPGDESLFLTVLRRHLAVRAAPVVAGAADASASAPLLEMSLPDLGLDSTGVISLILDLEDAFGIIFPPESLTDRTLLSARSLARETYELRDRANY